MTTQIGGSPGGKPSSRRLGKWKDANFGLSSTGKKSTNRKLKGNK